MKKVFLIVLPALLALAGCHDEMDVTPSQEKTFFHYYGSEYNNKAVQVLESDGGFTMLAQVEIISGQSAKYKAKLIHTNEYGEIIWQSVYPAFGGTSTFGTDDSFKPSSFIPLENGYLMVGERIQLDGAVDLYLMEVSSSDGSLVAEKNLTANKGTIHGRAVAKKGSGNLIVLGNVTNNQPNDMFLAELNSNYDTLWTRQYGSTSPNVTTGTLLNKVFLNDNGTVTWGGSFESDFRLIAAKENYQTTEVDNFYGDKTSVQNAFDITNLTDNDFAFLGSTNSVGDDDILLMRVSESGNTLFSSDPYNFLTTETSSARGNDKGNSVAATSDGGFIVLGTVESNDVKGNGRTDYVLIKMNLRGKVEWDINYGGKDKEEGASVIQTSDGYYLAFGTTYFGNLLKLALIKVDPKGQL